ncbi:hypothetical protein CUD01_11590 [Cellulomonas uda]|uniref:Uncharacterized protein n=1 Tax=Cellulomonas uda TaxID=1714 RepID=A0A4Y3KCG6_CELUD|nr:hypothetical protein CUD01_11590 [Cellulomonas uda]
MRAHKLYRSGEIVEQLDRLAVRGSRVEEPCRRSLARQWLSTLVLVLRLAERPVSGEQHAHVVGADGRRGT